MRLTELDPRWLVRDGHRVGFVFKSPTNPQWYQSCVTVCTPLHDQEDLFNAALPDVAEKPEYAFTKVQGCNQACAWTVAGGIENATFETISVTPSIDGSAGGLWHGFITNGEVQ